MRLKHGKFAAAIVLIGIAGAPGTGRAAGGFGLAVDAAGSDSGGSPWQGRIAYATSAPVWRSGLGGFESGGFTVKQARGLTSLNLLGDYFFAPSLAPSGGVGGLRATSGVLVGTRAQLSLSQPSLPGGLFAPRGRVFGASTLPYSPDANSESAALPYLGLGYTGLSAGSGWSFSADLGLVGSGSSNAASRLFGSGQRSLDDSARDGRFMPLLQVGVLYSF